MRFRNYGLHLAAAFVLLASVFGSAGTALAADTWTPAFNGSRIQVSSDVPMNQSELSAASAELDRLSAKDHIQYYEVITRHGDDAAPAGANYAEYKLGQMYSQWQAQSGFPVNDACVAMVVYGKTRGDWYAAKCPARLQSPYALNGIWVTSTTKDLANQYLPSRPAPFAVAFAEKVNGAVDSYNFNHYELPWIILGIVLALLLAGWSFYWASLRSKTDKLIKTWLDISTRADKWFDSLDEDLENLVYLKEAADEAAKTGDTNNETVTKYNAQKKNLAEVARRKLALSGLVDGVQKDRKSAFYPLPFVFWNITKRLTVGKVTVTGKQLAAYQGSLFGNDDASYVPNDLVKGLEDLIKSTHAELETITTAIKTTRANAASIAEQFGKVDTVKPELESRSLPFTPYQARYDELKKRADAVQALVLTNALKAQSESEAIKSGVTALEGDLEHAVSLFDGLKQTDAAISNAESDAANTRQEAVNFAYPFAEGENHASGQGNTFSLSEDNGNPDGFVAQSKTHSAAARKALIAGELATADSEKAEADAQAASAVSVVAAVKKAKSDVEQHVPQARTKLTRLNSEIGRAKPAVAELTAHFLPVNTQGQPEKLERAKTISASTAAELAIIEKSYLEQRFIAAAARLNALDTNIQDSTDHLQDIHTCLSTLTADRQKAKEAIATINGEYSRISKKARTESHSTSAQVDEELFSIGERVSAFKSAANQDVADWVKEAEEADAIAQALETAEQAIDTQKAQYLEAGRQVAAANTAYEQAAQYVDQKYVLAGTKAELETAYTKLNAASLALQTPKSDWAAIGTSAAEANTAASNAQASAITEHQQGGEAAAAINTASVAVAGSLVYGGILTYKTQAMVGGVLQDFVVEVSYVSAITDLNEAKQAFNAGNYPDAIEYANEAISAAATAAIAAANAQAQLQSQVQQAQEAWEEANRPAPVDTGNGGGFGGGVQIDDPSVGGGDQVDDDPSIGGGDQGNPD